MRIRYKLTGLLLIFTLSITVIFYLVGLKNQKKDFELVANEHIKNIEATFHNLLERDTKILFSTLEVIVQDPAIKEIYLENNRGKLYDYGQPLFQRLKDKYGITHFYFILPDGRVFLRMHNKYIYGDVVERSSFHKSRETEGPAWEIELGKTAFALRTVMPYYEAGNLIGYVELGEEIDHLLHILKGETDSEFGLFADKQYLDRDDWRSTRSVGGLRDNWDDMDMHLVVSSTKVGKFTERCFVEYNLEKIEEGESILQHIKDKERTYMCNGFDLKDAMGRYIGAVMLLSDITRQVSIALKGNNAILGMTIILFFVIFTIGILISRSITKPILKLVDVAKAIGKGDLERRVIVNSSDEIGLLGSTFNEMVDKRKLVEEALMYSEDKFRSIVNSTEDSIYMVDRDYRYLFVNNNHISRLGLPEGQYMNKAFSEFHSPEETRLFIEKAGKVFNTRNSFQYEFKSVRDDKYFLQTFSPVRNSKNEITAVTVVSKEITAFKNAEEILYSMTITDELTGLYNRRGFLTLSDQQLKQANRDNKKMFLMSSDLDHLKLINDHLGHKAGDRALINIANILKETFRESDIVARIGGDEFIVLGMVTPYYGIETLTERLKENINAHNALADEPLEDISLSFGFSLYDPSQPCSIDELLTRADQLMYAAKRNTR